QQIRMRHRELGRVVLAPVDQEQVDVDRTRRVVWRRQVTPQLDLDVLARGKQRRRVEVGLDLDARVQEVVLPDRAGLWLGLVDRRARGDADAATLQRIE